MEPRSIESAIKLPSLKVMKNFTTAIMLGISATTLGIVLESAPANSATFSFSGNLNDPNEIRSFFFTVPTTILPSTIKIESTSYAAGGFDPNLTLFDAGDNWIDERDDISFGNLDFLYEEPLAAGNYRAVIAALGNNSAGFGDINTPFNGQGTFDGRTSAFAFTIDIAAPVATAVPEPISFFGTTLAGFAVAGLKRKLASSHKNQLKISDRSK
jgi:hypothetical protein